MTDPQHTEPPEESSAPEQSASPEESPAPQQLPFPEESGEAAAPAPEQEAAPSDDAPAAEAADALDNYPAWARDLARKYLTKTLTQFILYGNVRDLVPGEDEEGRLAYAPLREFLVDDLFAARDMVIFYDRSAGIHFADAASRKDFHRAVSGYDAIFGTEYARSLPRDPVRVFSVLENYFRTRLADGLRIACVVDYAETIVPMAEASMYSAEDRNALVFLQKWAHDPVFLSGDFTLCLIAENLTDLNRQLVQSPYTAEIRIPMPDEKDRLAFVRSTLLDREDLFAEHSEVSPEAVAHHTAGLGYTQLRTILADLLENLAPLTFETLSGMKKEFIEAEAYGMLEFVETGFNLDQVAGHREAKAHLRQAADALRRGRPDVLPMGYLVSGPVGTGKTFLITCFAGEIGVPMVTLKNFRSQWQGVTEGNLEKILHLLEAMTPVAVMIDEADTALGNRGAQGDSGVSSRVFGQIATFMSDPSHRGRILFFLVTARPDLMPIDLKRQGRAEEHIALFYPEAKDEREELLRVVMQRTGARLDMGDIPDVLLNGDRPFSGADMEALFTRAKFRASAQRTGDAEAPADAANNAQSISRNILEEAVDDFIPPAYPEEVELQTLVAVLECTSRTLLPEKYRAMERADIIRRVQELKRLAE